MPTRNTHRKKTAAGGISVDIQDLQRALPVHPARVISLVKECLLHEHVTVANLSITFVSRQKISALNKQFLGRAYATDVISFDLADASMKLALIGEVVVSTDAAIANTRVYGEPTARELARYVIHGVLHLLGYDDHNPDDIRAMRAKEEELLQHAARHIRSLI